MWFILYGNHFLYPGPVLGIEMNKAQLLLSKAHSSLHVTSYKVVNENKEEREGRAMPGVGWKYEISIAP